MGNVKSIADGVSGDNQTFTYDDLDRLSTAQASGGNGGTYAQESYNYYLQTGNLISKAGVTLQYSAQVNCGFEARTIPHAVSQSGPDTYGYDCNGNMLSMTTMPSSSCH